jgi:hypothetical protein
LQARRLLDEHHVVHLQPDDLVDLVIDDGHEGPFFVYSRHGAEDSPIGAAEGRPANAAPPVVDAKGAVVAPVVMGEERLQR